MKLNNLFSPLRVRNVILKNRVVVAPMGIPKAKLISTNYIGGLSLEDKALGGSAVVTVATDALARIAGEENAFDKYALDVTREVYSIMKEGGGLAMAETHFHGPMNEDGSFQGPSDGTHFTGGVMKQMTHEQMDKAIDRLCEEALRIKNFGFDMLMVHMGHDSLCSIFLSPVWNKRTDEYGGSVENRSRFMIEALKKLRETVGDNYPIMVRFSRELKVPETYAEEDMLYLLKQVDKYIDIANISCGMDCYGGIVEKYVANTYTHTTIFQPRMYNLDFASRVKKETNLKVCLVGGVSDPVLCDELIGNGSIDMVMLGRQLVADPFWPKKAQEGKLDEIVPCLRCLNCYHIASKHNNTQCSVNPRFRRENRVPLKLDKTDNPKNVVIIGGGPAGMKAALTADEKGHKVTLIEKENRLGGNLKYADYGDYKEDLKKYCEYLINHVNKSNIDVRLNTCADNELLKSLNPDKVIIAIGADFIRPGIKGIEHAILAVDIYDHIDDIKGKSIVIGGGSIGSEIGMELSNRGNEVIVIDAADVLAKNGNWLYRNGLYNAIKDSDNPMKSMLNSTVKEIKENGVVVECDGKEEFVEADNILYCVGMKTKTEEVSDLFISGVDTSYVGDCYKVASVMEATNDAYFIAANI